MSKLPYSHIGIIYNPNSSGNAPAKAKRLQHLLQKKLPDIPLTLQQTERAGHAEELAYELASQSKTALIVSVSGDGGYHEVINGALRAAKEHRTRPICAVRDAGNANDHRRTLKENPLARAIVDGKVQTIDLLKLEAANKSGTITSRLAHSYIGLGITPIAATELNRQQLTGWREVLLVFKTFLHFSPFTIKIEGQRRQFDSIVFANIKQMAKVLKLSKDSRANDGMFEVIEQPHKSRAAVLITAIQAALFPLKPQPRRQSYKFTVIEDLPMQMDGEVQKLKSGTKVTISIAPKALRTIL